MAYKIISTGSVKLIWQPHVPMFPSHLLVLAEETWRKRHHPDLFNGSLLMHLNTQILENGVELLGAFTDYRFYYTQKQTGADFELCPIAVSGIIICQGQIIIGQRADHVTSYAGWWELVPSGTLDLSVAQDDSTVDYVTKLSEEFTEETLLPISEIQSIEALGVIFDPDDRTYDIACEIRLDTPPDQVLASMRQSPEYADAKAIPITEISDWLNHERLLPTSRAILSLWNPTPC